VTSTARSSAGVFERERQNLGTTEASLAQPAAESKRNGIGEVSFRVTRDADARTERKGVNGPTADIGTTSVEVTIRHPSWAMGQLRVHEVTEGNHMDRTAPNYYGDDLLRFSFTTPDRGASIMREFAEALEAAARGIREIIAPVAPAASKLAAIEDVAGWQERTGR
jgi:hypothetical protein